MALALLALGTACSSGSEKGAGEAPPGSKEDVAKAFGPAVDELGLRITRAGLVARFGQRGYTASGRHLAVYVEPKGPLGNDGYVANLVPLARAFLPEVFDRFPHIETFDVCQEPPPGVDDRPEPRTFTQLVVHRDQAQALDWQRLDAASLMAASRRAPSQLVLGGAPEVLSSPAWARASAQAVSPRPGGE